MNYCNGFVTSFNCSEKNVVQALYLSTVNMVIMTFLQPVQASVIY